jgi:hypothetical protein
MKRYAIRYTSGKVVFENWRLKKAAKESKAEN